MTNKDIDMINKGIHIEHRRNAYRKIWNFYENWFIAEPDKHIDEFNAELESLRNQYKDNEISLDFIELILKDLRKVGVLSYAE